MWPVEWSLWLSEKHHIHLGKGNDYHRVVLPASAYDRRFKGRASRHLQNQFMEGFGAIGCQLPSYGFTSNPLSIASYVIQRNAGPN
jgi:hypothetical protein